MIPWDERVSAISINPDMATREDVARLASELMSEEKRCRFWEDAANKAQESSDYYQQQFVDAHTLIGRIIHQASERWDSINLTKYFPTDNLHGKRTLKNPKGKQK